MKTKILSLLVILLAIFTANIYADGVVGDTISKSDTVEITILHFNDFHSWIEPCPDRYNKEVKRGGMPMMLAEINSVRKQEENVILLCAGDIFQGTPYFNMFNGRVEIEIFNLYGIDAMTIGNHEFDLKFDTLVKRMAEAEFPLISANYDFSNTAAADIVKPYTIIEKEGVKIGIFGIGVQLEGLVLKENYDGVIYNDAYEVANQTSKYLKEDLECDFVICLSHIGYDDTDPNDDYSLCDSNLAKQSLDIDIIVGGHSHTFNLRHGDYMKNAMGNDVLISHAGANGMYIGRLDLLFIKN